MAKALGSFPTRAVVIFRGHITFYRSIVLRRKPLHLTRMEPVRHYKWSFHQKLVMNPYGSSHRGHIISVHDGAPTRALTWQRFKTGSLVHTEERRRSLSTYTSSPASFAWLTALRVIISCAPRVGGDDQYMAVITYDLLSSII